MPVCPNCGKEIAEDVLFCPQCGQRLKRGFTPEEKQKYIEDLEASVEEQKPPGKAEMRKRKPVAFIIASIIVLFLVIIAVIPGESATTPDGIAIEVLGTPTSDEDSGVLLANYDGEALRVEYQFFPLGLFALEKEASCDLAPMFKGVFEKTTASEVQVQVLGPFEDKYGNYIWKPVLTMGMTRASFEKINWEHLIDMQFYRACDIYWKRPGLPK